MMKTKSRILISVVSSLAVSIVIALMAFSILKGMNTELRRGQTYMDIIDKTHALNILTASLKEESGKSDIRQVRGILLSLDNLLKGISSRVPGEAVLIKQLQKNNQELGPFIDQMFVSVPNMVSGIEKERRNILASQIWMKVRFISDDTSRLMDISQSRMMAAQEKAGAAVIVLIIILALTNGGIYFFSGRGIVRAQEALKQSEERYRELVENASSIILRSDRHGNITFFNEFAQRFFGYTKDEILGKNAVGTIIPATDSEGNDLAAMIDHMLRHPDEYRTNAHQNRRKNGELVWVSWTNQAVYDDQGNLTGLLCVGNDITRIMQAEEIIRKSEEKYKQIIAYAPSAIYEIDFKKKQFETVNEGMCRMLGYTEEELLAMNPLDLLDRESRERFLDRVRQAQAGETPSDQIEYKAKRKDGLDIWGILHTQFKYAEGKIVGAFVVAHDITERKKAEG